MYTHDNIYTHMSIIILDMLDVEDYIATSMACGVTPSKMNI
jgi:hypothetical protein